MKKIEDIILYEDNQVIVAVKPAGILSQEDITKDDDMLTLLKAYIKEKYQKTGNVFLGLVHRLDRMTGGIMVFARTSKAASRLASNMNTSNFQKRYLAILEGEYQEDQGVLSDYLVKNEMLVKSFVTDEANGKIASLKFKVMKRWNNMTLVSIYLETGRHHQIRVQFSSRGFPLVGDTLYGAKTKTLLALFSYQLEFLHPTKQIVMKFNAYPDGTLWRDALQGFIKENPKNNIN